MCSGNLFLLSTGMELCSFYHIEAIFIREKALKNYLQILFGTWYLL